MFLLIDTRAYRKLQGFDEGLFLYYEDLACAFSTWQQGGWVAVSLIFAICHGARRDSLRNPRHLIWQVHSLSHYFGKWWGRIPDIAKQAGAQSAAQR